MGLGSEHVWCLTVLVVYGRRTHECFFGYVNVHRLYSQIFCGEIFHVLPVGTNVADGDPARYEDPAHCAGSDFDRFLLCNLFNWRVKYMKLKRKKHGTQ